MDASDRLRLLFDGEDEALLHTKAVGLQPPRETTEQSLNLDAAPKVSASQTADSERDEAFKDEYLASFARAEKDAAREQSAKKKKKKTKKNASHNRKSAAAMMADDNFPAQPGGPQAPPNDSGVHYFCPIVAISRFPYKYMRGSDVGLIAKSFFDGGKFWERSWDLYYIHPPRDISLNPLVLVPRALVQKLLDEINGAFHSSLSIPSKPELGVLLAFENDGTPQPQYLGTSESREMKESLESRIPPRDADSAPPPGCAFEVDHSFTAFKAKIEAAVEATRRKSKAARGKRQREQAVKLQDWCRSLKRLQCYLGLRPRLPRGMQSQGDVGKGMSWDEQQQATRDHALACGTTLLPLDVGQAAVFSFADEPIFVCIDVESNEKSHDQITEIGISTLDTLDLAGVPPGPDGCNWMTRIRSRHFRISEYSHVVNGNYIMGCPDAFEFGKSEWISIKQAGDIVDSCFSPPYSADGCFGLSTLALSQEQGAAQDSKTETPDEREITSEKTSTGSDSPANVGGVHFSFEGAPAESIEEHKKRPRKLILVGHDILADIAYMRKLGCKVLNSDARSDPSKSHDGQPVFLESLDTSALFRVLKRETQPSSLGKVLVDLGIVGWNLHNAGNDARYTMRAMIGIALRSRLQDGNKTEGHSAATGDWALEVRDKGDDGSAVPNSAWKAEVDRRVAVQVSETATRVREECGLWDTVLGSRGDWDIADDDLDGGDAPGITFGAENGASRSKPGANPGNTRSNAEKK